MAGQIIPLTDDELKALAPQFDRDPAMLNKLTSDERRRLEQFKSTTPENGSPFSDAPAPVRFMAGAAEALNPIPFAKALKEDPKAAFMSIPQAMGDEYRKAATAPTLSEKVGHYVAGTLPVIGPAAAKAGETIASGDVAGGLGQSAALLAPFESARAAISVPAKAAVRGAGMMLPESVPARIEQAAANKFVDVAAPKVGPNKMRFGSNAEQVAPDILRDPNLGAITRQGLQGKIEAKLADAQDALDVAANGRNAGAAYPTKPILDALRAKRAELTAEAVQGNQVSYGPKAQQQQTPQGTMHAGMGRGTYPGPEIGADVVPGPNAGRVAVIDRAIKEVEQLGSVARYESLRRIREAYDQPAKVKYSPAVTPDFLAKQGEASGAADVTGSLRDNLAKISPETAAANADYSLYRKAHDVLQATEETERQRPKAGRAMMARLTGAVAGGSEAGVEGASVGALVGHVLERIGDSGLTTKIYTARLLQDLADAMRGNRPTQIASVKSKLQRVVTGATRTAGLAGDAMSPVAFPKAAQDESDEPVRTAQVQRSR